MDEKKREISHREFKVYIQAWGNEGYLKSHIVYFEKKIENEIEPWRRINDNALAECHNFAVWVRLYTELICNSLCWSLHRSSGNWERIKELSFTELKEEIIDVISCNNKIDKSSKHKIHTKVKALQFVIELRHSLQHGGMPNPMRGKRCVVSEKVLRKMFDTRYYKRTKILFSSTYELVNSLPKPEIILCSGDI